jgi:hypothetical protein
MSELKLQSDISVEFSRRFPKMRGQLFHVSNERNNKVQAFQARAIGIIPGVSDFLFFERNHKRIHLIEELDIRLIGIEIKAPNSRHLVDHVRLQLEWGKVLESSGGRWFLARSVKDAMCIIEGNYKDILSVEDVEEMLNDCKTKTIKF